MAHLALPPGHRPFDRALLRSKEGRTRANFLSKTRVVYSILTGVELSSVTLADLQQWAWHQLSVDDATDFHRAVYQRYPAQASRNDMVCNLRRIEHECYKRGLISAQRHDLLRAALYTVAVDTDSTRRRRLSQGEVAALMRAAAASTNPRASARDTAVIALLRTTGMRGCELVRASLSDFDEEQHTLLLRDTKNSHPHLVFLSPQAEEYLRLWLAHRGVEPGALFTAVNRGDLKHLHVSSVRLMLQRRARGADVAAFGMHDFRRTFASDLLGKFDPALVSKLLNHRKIDSTMRYDVRGDELKREAVASLELPTVPLAAAQPYATPFVGGRTATSEGCPQ